MQPQEMYDLLHQEPFQPFRVYLKDGRIFDIRYPDLNRATVTSFLIGIPLVGAPDPRAERAVYVAWENITRVEPLPQSAPTY